MYNMEFLERTMAMPMRKTKASSSASFNGDRRFPAEAYDYADDVTPEAVQQIREKASKVIDAEEWEVVDGFGLATRT